MSQTLIAAEESSDGWIAEKVEEEDGEADDHNDYGVEKGAP